MRAQSPIPLNPKTSQRAKLTALRSGELFSWVLVGGEEVVEGRPMKPHPAAFLRACRVVGRDGVLKV